MDLSEVEILVVEDNPNDAELAIKIGIYEIILNKPGGLIVEELAIIKMHPIKGEEILKPIG